MSISKKAIDTIHGQLMVSKSGHTYAELAKLTGYSIATVKIAISSLNHSGAIAMSHAKPTVIKSVAIVPAAGQTLFIREMADALELDPKMMEAIQGHLESDNAFHDEMLTVLYTRIRGNSPEKNHNLMVFLVNLSEVLRRRLEANKELSMDDLMEGTA